MHQLAKKFFLRPGVVNYQYDYSGSSWHLGAPKKLDAKPILGFPTYDDATVVTVSMTARF